MTLEEQRTGAWTEACGTDDIDEEDVIRFDHGGRTFAIYRSPDDEYFATTGCAPTKKFISPADW
jgi:3-phenylpropionate/trans-cinnamate dioxygenase ferredoxin subunit